MKRSRRNPGRSSGHLPASAGSLAAEQGIAIVFVSILLLMLIIFVSIAIDLGRGYFNRRDMQISADAASLAAVAQVEPQGTLAENLLLAVPEARRLLEANGATAAEAASAQIEIGYWESEVFTSGVSPFNAVRIDLQRSLPVRFAGVMGWSSLAPRVVSVALRDSPTGAQCVVPFGVLDDIVEGKEFGDVIDIGFESPGNWGKLDVGGNMSSGANFGTLFVTGVCDSIVRIDDQISPGTGFAEVPDAFQDRMADNPFIIIPIIDVWPNGNSAPVTVKGFMKFRILSEEQDGANWSGRLEIVKGFIGSGIGGPSDEPYALTRTLVQ